VASGASFGDGGDGLYYLTEKIDNFKQYFKLPLGGYRVPADASFLSKGVNGYYWSSSPNSQASRKARSSDGQGASFFDRAFGLSVRCFKNEYVPDPETTNLVDTQAWVEGKDFETITISNPEDSSE
jgi:hypothetical protein